MMHSWAGAKGWSLCTNSRASRGVVATFRYHLTSLILVAFFEGLVPCVKCACVPLRSGQSLWIPSQVSCLWKIASFYPRLCLTLMCGKQHITLFGSQNTELALRWQGILAHKVWRDIGCTSEMPNRCLVETGGGQKCGNLRASWYLSPAQLVECLDTELAVNEYARLVLWLDDIWAAAFCCKGNGEGLNLSWQPLNLTLPKFGNEESCQFGISISIGIECGANCMGYSAICYNPQLVTRLWKGYGLATRELDLGPLKGLLSWDCLSAFRSSSGEGWLHSWRVLWTKLNRHQQRNGAGEQS